MKEFKRYLVTSALPYANGPLHVGHISGAYLPADIYVRYLRLKGEDVKFICGSDEHGVPITLRARKEGITPQQVVDKYHKMNQESFKKLGIDFDIYHRTSDKLHHETAQVFFKNLYDKGVFLEKETEQFYDEKEEIFLADRYIIGTCPKCSNENAYGDQCENCGSTLSPNELKDPRSALSGEPPVKKKTKHWYLPLDMMQKEWLEDWIDSHKPFGEIIKGENEVWKTNVYGQCKSWLKEGLKPRAVTRDLDWGVKVPLKEAEGKVLYVWFDAPIGYISATKALTKDWEKYWKDENTKLVHFIGKDNIVFHCIIFPAMLKAHGEYVLPENVPANEFMNMEGDKISTSRNWAVWLHEYLEEFKSKEDVLRYVLCANMPETKDSDFTWKDFQSRNNNELVAILGNFVNRVIVLTHKYTKGLVPKSAKGMDEKLHRKIDARVAGINSSIEKYWFRTALNLLMGVARDGNKYLTDTEPWKLDKDDPKIPMVLCNCLQVCAVLNVYMQIFMPFTAKKLAGILNLDLKSIKFEEIHKINILKAGVQLGQPMHLFTKIEDDIIEQQIQKLQSKQSKKQNNFKPMIQFDDFEKMDIRVGTILEAEKVPDTDKLLKLSLDLRSEKRTVVSGIAEYYQPEDIIGLQVSILVNLQPRKIKGIESQGMILMAEDDKGKLAFVSPAEKIDSGSVIR